jgi:hypothetical protein
VSKAQLDPKVLPALVQLVLLVAKVLLDSQGHRGQQVFRVCLQARVELVLQEKSDQRVPLVVKALLAKLVQLDRKVFQVRQLFWVPLVVPVLLDQTVL